MAKTDDGGYDCKVWPATSKKYNQQLVAAYNTNMWSKITSIAKTAKASVEANRKYIHGIINKVRKKNHNLKRKGVKKKKESVCVSVSCVCVSKL